MNKHSRSHQEEEEIEAHAKGRNVSPIEQIEIALDNNRARKHPRSHQVQSYKPLVAERQKLTLFFLCEPIPSLL